MARTILSERKACHTAIKSIWTRHGDGCTPASYLASWFIVIRIAFIDAYASNRGTDNMHRIAASREADSDRREDDSITWTIARTDERGAGQKAPELRRTGLRTLALEKEGVHRALEVHHDAVRRIGWNGHFGVFQSLLVAIQGKAEFGELIFGGGIWCCEKSCKNDEKETNLHRSSTFVCPEELWYCWLKDRGRRCCRGQCSRGGATTYILIGGGSTGSVGISVPQQLSALPWGLHFVLGMLLKAPVLFLFFIVSSVNACPSLEIMSLAYSVVHCIAGSLPYSFALLPGDGWRGDTVTCVLFSCNGSAGSTYNGSTNWRLWCIMSKSTHH